MGGGSGDIDGDVMVGGGVGRGDDDGCNMMVVVWAVV